MVVIDWHVKKRSPAVYQIQYYGKKYLRNEEVIFSKIRFIQLDGSRVLRQLKEEYFGIFRATEMPTKPSISQ